MMKVWAAALLLAVLVACGAARFEPSSLRLAAVPRPGPPPSPAPLPTAGPSRPPIVILPGLLGSRLYATLDRPSVEHYWCSKQSPRYQLWLDPSEFYPLAVDCLFNNLGLQYNASTAAFGPLPGVAVDVPTALADVYSLGPDNNTFPVYQYWVSQLAPLGYKADVDVRASTYDWRYGFDRWNTTDFPRTKAHIEAAYADNGNRSVALLSISLGGVYGHQFLVHHVSAEWKAKYIAGWVSQAPALAGSLSSIIEQYTGVFSSEYITELIRAFTRSIGSVYSMYPLPSVYGDTPILRTPYGTFTSANLSDSGADYGFPGMGPYVAAMNRAAHPTVAPGVKVFCQYSTDVPTPMTLTIEDKHPLPSKVGFSVESVGGDGTVPLKGLMTCPQWASSQSQPVAAQSYGNVTHVGYLVDPKAVADGIQYITHL